MRLWFIPLLVAAPAAAEPAPSDALAPVVMPELVARSRIELGVTAATLQITDEAATARLGVRYAVIPAVELFGRLTWNGYTIAIECETSPCSGQSLGNTVLGARYLHDVPLVTGRLALAGAAWGWLPTAGGSGVGGQDAAFFGGLEDTRAFHGGLAAGTSAAAAWYGERALVQAEAGLAIDLDPDEGGGAVVDNLFFALAAGRHVREQLSLVGEWRFDVYPPAPAGMLAGPYVRFRQAPGLALAKDDGSRVAWRVRVHAIMNNNYFLDHVVDGVAIGFDWNGYLP